MIYKAQYLKCMPTVELSIIKLLASFNNIYIYKLQKQARMRYGCFKQLLVLSLEMDVRRKASIGLNAWYNSTHTGIINIKRRREHFANNNLLLVSLGYVIIYEVPRGRNAEITASGRLFLNSMDEFLMEYVSNFYASYNLTPVI